MLAVNVSRMTAALLKKFQMDFNEAGTFAMIITKQDGGWKAN